MFSAGYLDSLRGGDPTAQEHFVSHFSPILLRKLRRKLGSVDRARDARQETFLRVLAALRSPDAVRNPERFEIFVLGVCTNVMREIYRKERPLQPLDDVKVELASPVAGPLACALTEETGRAVRKVLMRMPPTDREILKAVFMQEMDRDEICRRFSISRSHLRLLLFRAKQEFCACARKGAQTRLAAKARSIKTSGVRAKTQWRTASRKDAVCAMPMPAAFLQSPVATAERRWA
jgi:RNA polymerase sigma-70 factor (ECF subfamily)